MVLKIKLGRDRERRLKKHLEKEHPSVRGRTSIDNDDFSTRRQIERIENYVPDFKCSAMRFTQL